jgi:hypothetical protein
VSALPDYRHTQIGIVTLGILGTGMLMVGALLLARGPEAPLLAVLVILAVTAVLFGSLTIEIQAGILSLWFGPGLIGKCVPLAAIRSCTVVHNPWWYGWGIHLTPHGWLYNVSGRAAVELTLQNGRHLRIGTDEPQRLCQAIGQACIAAPA